MVRFLQIALTWLLALALPAQGYAAGAMVSCEQAHHHAAIAAPMHERAATDAHHHGVQAHEQDAHEQGAPAGIVQDDGAAVDATCSVCAACCNVAAIATSVPDFAVAPAAGDFGAISFEHRARATTGGLERPPRIVLA